MDIDFYFILFVSLFSLSAILTLVIRTIAIKFMIIDFPNDRSSHTTPTPRGGGLAIILVWYLGTVIFYFFDYIELNLYISLLCGVLLAIVSFIDDIYNISPGIRLATQFITVALSLLIMNKFDLPANENPIIGIFSLSISVIGLVWFINLFNFLDGIDGYASVEAIFVLLAMYLFTFNSLIIVLVASVAGFLIWNWPKAKIFMGDVGSTQLGFILGVLGIYFHNNGELDILKWLMITSMFWFDATLTLYRRWKNNETLSVAHNKHAYQRIVQSGYSHKKTLILSIFVNLVIFGMVFLADYFTALQIPLLILNIIFLYVIVKLIDKRVPFI